MSPRVAFITIGQSPRDDVVPEILAQTRAQFLVTERGALDGLDDRAIAALAPRPDEERLVTRLRDGREVLLGQPAIEHRLRSIIAELDEDGFDLLVLLCTGQFGHFATRTPFIEPQHLVEHVAQGLAYGADRIGVVLPSSAQIEGFHGIPNVATTVVSASPYLPEYQAALRDAGDALVGADVIVLHCIGYTLEMQQLVKTVSGRPVLVSRGVVAHAVDMLLS